jgi:primosomal protein N' (replication factor Y)
VPLIDVALPLPLFRTFSYRLPEGLGGSVAAGSRVLVPFRYKREIGIVLGHAEPRDGVKY